MSSVFTSVNNVDSANSDTAIDSNNPTDRNDPLPTESTSAITGSAEVVTTDSLAFLPKGVAKILGEQLPASSVEEQHKWQLKIYDTLSAKKCRFEPLHAGEARIYVCGMTVYDYCHIGHARVMVAFDAVVRWLQYIGYQVTYIRNITDIDDKIITRAAENNESIQELTARFITAMQEDAATLGCQPPTQEPKATEHIAEMQSMIQTLMDKSFAYTAPNGDVYYDVERFEGYGKLSKRKQDQLQAGARVAVDNDKRHPHDFVLWKHAKPDEPHWQSPWGLGRPGWHIECSAMSTKCLGHTFDIHGGGHDLQFPHHENEIAQTEAATGCQYARNWMHVGFVNVDGEKMSKSLGNFFTIREVLEHHQPETVRFFILQSHYRSPISFSDVALQEAHAALSRLYQTLKLTLAEAADLDDVQSQEANNTLLTRHASEVAPWYAQFVHAMNDDFNTALALSVLFQLAREVNTAHAKQETELAQALAYTLKSLGATLNLLQSDPISFLQAGSGKQQGALDDDEIEAMIAARTQAKLDKDFARADEIRASLKQAGVELEDSKAGTTWRRL